MWVLKLFESKVCRFDNEVLHRVKSSKSQLRREPFEGTHRKVVVISLSDSELRCEISEGIELVGSVEFLIVFAVTALNFAVMPGRIRADEFVPDAELGKCFLKESGTVGFRMVQPVGEL